MKEGNRCIVYYPPTQDNVTLIEYYGLPGGNCPLRFMELNIGFFIIDVKFSGYIRCLVADFGSYVNDLFGNFS